MIMVYANDRTLELKEAVRYLEQRYPPGKRQRVKFGRAANAPAPSSSSKASAGGLTFTVAGGQPQIQEDAWTRQAVQIAKNLRSFSSFLLSIRRAYLDLGSSSVHHNSQARKLDTTKGLAAWEGVKWLNDRERDEIDFGVKVALRKSMDRVRELESAEKVRTSKEVKLNPNHGLSRLLGLPTPTASDSLAALANHRRYVTLYLNTMLAVVSQHQRDQQEARIKRQLEKSATLGGMGGGGAMGMDEHGKAQAEKAKAAHLMRAASQLNGSLREKGTTNAKAGGEVPSIYRPIPPSSISRNSGSNSLMQFDEDVYGGDAALTPAQIQQFEAEESALLRSTQAELDSIKSAESSLLEISSLQSQLAMHLTQQSELTDKLWEEALAVTGKVNEGNVQLKKARERNRESRTWLLVFLMMASGTLVFLDYYT